jgi:hypothetical protein
MGAATPKPPCSLWSLREGQALWLNFLNASVSLRRVSWFIPMSEGEEESSYDDWNASR